MGARFAYVQSRLQARHGRRLAEPDWRLLEATEDLAGYLQAARQTFFRDWIQHLAGSADIHQIERSLRQDWEAYCAEVAAWLTPPWRPLVEWLATIPYLPAVAHLADGGPAWRWMQNDPALEAVAVQDPEVRTRLLAASRYAALARTIAAGEEPLAAWLAEWRERSPGDAPEELVALIGMLETHFGSSLEAQSETPAARRRMLEHGFNRCFRRWAGGIGAVLTHLGLVALDAERLRAGLILRVLIPRSAGRPLWA